MEVSTAPSSLRMVPVATPFPSTAPVTLLMATLKVSSGSAIASPLTATSNTAEVRPASSSRSTWLRPAKSLPAVAVPLAVPISKVTGVCSGADNVTRKLAVVVP